MRKTQAGTDSARRAMTNHELQGPSPEADTRTADKAFEAYKLVLDLWARENPIKTTKLQVLLAVNTLLATGAVVSEGGLSREKWPIYLAAIVVDVLWTLSIGRTTLFQEAWSLKLKALSQEFSDDMRFQAHLTQRERG